MISEIALTVAAFRNECRIRPEWWRETSRLGGMVHSGLTALNNVLTSSGFRFLIVCMRFTAPVKEIQ
jgi:hypothetical protein